MTVLNQDIRILIRMGITYKYSDELLYQLVREGVPWLKNINGFIHACKNNNDIEAVDIESFRHPPLAFASEKPATESTETVLEKRAVEAHQDVLPIPEEADDRPSRLKKPKVVLVPDSESEDELSSVGSQLNDFSETTEFKTLKVEPSNVTHRVGAKEAKKLLGLPNEPYPLNYWQKKGWVYAVQPAGSKNFVYSLTQDVFDRAAKRTGRKAVNTIAKGKKQAADTSSSIEALPAENTVKSNLPQPSNEEQASMDRLSKARDARATSELEYKAAYSERDRISAEVSECGRALKHAEIKHINAEQHVRATRDMVAAARQSVHDAKRALNALKRKTI